MLIPFQGVTIDILATVTDKSSLHRFSGSNNFNLIILPTEQCNFRCAYCYEDFTNAKRMDKETVSGVKNLITKRSVLGLDHLNISWFGGEPLTAYAIVTDIMQHAKRTSESNNVSLSSHMTTNGYLLTADKLDALIENGVKSYQISFDGYKDIHDKYRLRADGKGTFDILWKNIVNAHKLKDADFDITIRIHVNNHNISSIKELLRKARDDLEEDNRFKFFIRPISRLGGHNDNNIPILADNDRVYASNIISMLREEAKSLGLVHISTSESNVCYAAKLDTLLIRQDGRLGKCTVALYDDRNTVGRLLKDGTVDIDRDKVLWWSRGLFTEDNFQLTCPLIAK